jgi:hypothetical protein
MTLLSDILLIIDLYSGDTPTQAEFQALWDGGARVLIIKSSMGFGDDSNVQQVFTWAKAIGFVVGIFHWLDGTATVASQLTRFSKWIDLLQPDFVGVDHEQYWADWQKYWDWCYYHTIPFSQVPILSPTVIDNVAKSFLTQLHIKYPKLYILLYTAHWFSSFDPGMASWIKNWPLWDADYTEWKGENTVFTTMDAFTLSVNTMENVKPILPDGALGCVVHQIGTTKLPGTNNYWDIDIFHGNLAQLKAVIAAGITFPVVLPPPQPIVIATYKVICTALNVHNAPNADAASRIGYLVYGDVRDVYQMSGVWGDYGNNHWFNTSAPYCTRIK